MLVIDRRPRVFVDVDSHEAIEPTRDTDVAPIDGGAIKRPGDGAMAAL
jgi:hypothetical protein